MQPNMTIVNRRDAQSGRRTVGGKPGPEAASGADGAGLDPGGEEAMICTRAFIIDERSESCPSSYSGVMDKKTVALPLVINKSVLDLGSNWPATRSKSCTVRTGLRLIS